MEIICSRFGKRSGKQTVLNVYKLVVIDYKYKTVWTKQTLCGKHCRILQILVYGSKAFCSPITNDAGVVNESGDTAVFSKKNTGAHHILFICDMHTFVKYIN